MRKSSKNPKPEHIGKISMYIIGRQYYDAAIARGEGVYFQRDPGNELYPDTILAINETHETVGFVARKNTEFLAPLIDEGKISLAGTVTATPEDTYVPITVDVYLHKKGKHFLKPIKAPATETEMIHEMVRRFFAKPGRVPADGILKIRERLKEFVKGDTLPETKLLVKMLPHQAKEQKEKLREHSLKAIDDYLKSLSCEAPIQFNNLSLFPILSSLKSSVNYLTLDETLEKKQVTITEVSEDGSVQELAVDNQAEQPVLILDGEELIGAKQNRVVSITVIIISHSRTVIPVSCMEQGRWSYQSNQFSAHQAAHMALRSQALGSAYNSVRKTGSFTSDQAAVWREVDRMQQDMGVTSKTDDLHEVYRARAKEFDNWQENLSCPQDCQGVLAAIDSEIVGGDIFDKPATLQKLWPKLLNSFTMEAMRRIDLKHSKPKQKKVKKPSGTAAQSFLKNIVQGDRKTVQIAGAGVNTEIKTESSFASATVYSGQIVHISMFSEQTEKF